MSLVITEKDLERIVAENYWQIFHEDEDEPEIIKIVRQFESKPFGIIDILVYYIYYDPMPVFDENGDYKKNEEGKFVVDMMPVRTIHIIELKIGELRERDISQLMRYRKGIESYYKSLGDTEAFRQYTLIGKSPEQITPPGDNGDFIFLHDSISNKAHNDYDIYLFEFGLNGFEFSQLETGWTRGNGTDHFRAMDEFLKGVKDVGVHTAVQ